ncbi:MAG: hypothetical protein CMO74_15225 [Verrucomicrobiales bacterium]|nr:hypothetical protein [Verrucomicrobiales bacterium]MBL69771.1 hypothetical protein [Verrucomicrobiales bacterium]|tara:strand:+ start:19241 stop:21385 length:2145 start_codon:yes stop_codon:yes gene_type:complete
MKHLPRICALILIVGFFLPCLPSGISGVSLVEGGIMLADISPEALEAIEHVVETMFMVEIADLKIQTGLLSLLLLATALIPATALAALVLDSKPAHAASGLVSIVLLAAWSFKFGKPIFDTLAYGSWICLGSGIAQLFVASKSRELPLGDFLADVENFTVTYASQLWGIMIVLFWTCLIADALYTRHLPLWLPITALVLQVTGAVCWLSQLRGKLEARGISGKTSIIAIPFAVSMLITWGYLWFLWHPGAAFISDTLLWTGFSIAFAVALLGLGTFRAYARPHWGRREFWMIATAAFIPTWQWFVFATDFFALEGLRVAVAKGGLLTAFFVGLAWTIHWVENRSREIQLLRRSSNPTGLAQASPLDAMNRSIASPDKRTWNPLDMDAWYYGRQRQKLKQSLNAFASYTALFIAIFLLLMSLTGCQEIYELPAGGGEPELKQKVIKQIIKIKEVPIVNPLSNLIRPVPPIEEILKNMLEETMHRYEVGQGQGKGAGFAGGTNKGKVRFIRLRYAGGDWDQDLDLNSDLNMLLWYASNTGQPAAKLPEVRSIGQLRNFPKMKSPPLVYMTGERGISISSSEVETLREYLVDKHGMLLADNGGSITWHNAFMNLMERHVLPNVKKRRIPIDHPVHSGLAAVPMPFPHDGGKGVVYGWTIENRIAVYYHPGDIGDAWADGHAGISRQHWMACYRLGGNIILYAHSEYSKWLQTQKQKD